MSTNNVQVLRRRLTGIALVAMIVVLAVAVGPGLRAEEQLTVKSKAGANGVVLLGPNGPAFTMSQPQDAEPGEEKPDEEQAEKEPGGLRELTPREINRIRYMELRGMRTKSDRPDRVSVKIPEETINDFLVDMEGHKDFEGEKARQNFRKLTAPLKLHRIAFYQGAKYADKVEITSDPEVFIEFKKNVMPVVRRSCATSSCHGSGEQAISRFVLFNDPEKNTARMYANFIVLNETRVEGHYLIDRGQEDNSLLLTYMLPIKDVKPELRHPGNVKYRPIFQSRTTLGYRRIKQWITSLKHPAEDYGVRLEASPEEAETMPQSQPAEGKPEQPGPKPGESTSKAGEGPLKRPGEQAGR